MNKTTDSNVPAEELLQQLVQYGILNISESLTKYDMAKRQEILSQYQIWQNKTTGRWYTHLPDETKKEHRRLIGRAKKEDLEGDILKYHKEQESKEILTVNKVFDLWLKSKSANLKGQTIVRYRNIFEKFIEPSWFGKMDIRKVTLKDLQRYCSETIGQNQMTAKCWEGIRTNLIGIIRYAKTDALTTLSVTSIKDIDIPKNAFKKKICLPGDDVLTKNDIKLINAYIDEHSDDIQLLGIRLILKTGLRVGELAALKYTDLNKENGTLIVSRAEQKIPNPNNDGPTLIPAVVDGTKGRQGWREIIIDQATIDLIETIHSKNPNGVYLFEKNGQRMNANCWTKRLPRICAKLEIGERAVRAKDDKEELRNYSLKKSPHKGRKNYLSMLLREGVDPKFVQMQAGHTDISTTLKYYNRDIDDLESRKAALTSILEKL